MTDGYSKSRLNAVSHGHVVGGKESPTYMSWKAMKRRCNSFPAYANISYPEEWGQFENFLRDMGVRLDGTSLDRIDGSKDYSKQNCRWADRWTQNQNRSVVALTKPQAKLAITLSSSGFKAKDIAVKLNCSAQNIHDILAGRSWGDL